MQSLPRLKHTVEEYAQQRKPLETLLYFGLVVDICVPTLCMCIICRGGTTEQWPLSRRVGKGWLLGRDERAEQHSHGSRPFIRVHLCCLHALLWRNHLLHEVSTDKSDDVRSCVAQTNTNDNWQAAEVRAAVTLGW